MSMNFNKRKRVTNAIALGVIKGLSFLAVGLLVLIIGYLVYRGLYKSERTESDVIPMAIMDKSRIEDVRLPVTVLANKGANIKHLSWFTLQDMALGRVSSLRRISATDEIFYLYVDECAVDDFSAMLCIAPEQLVSGGAIIASREQVLEQGRQRAGSVVILAEDAPKKVPKGFFVPVVDSYVLAANPSVTALYGNNRVGTLTTDQVVDLLDGRISNWASLSGGDVPVVLLGSSVASNTLIADLVATEGSVAVLAARTDRIRKNLDDLMEGRNLESSVKKALDMEISYREPLTVDGMKIPSNLAEALLPPDKEVDDGSFLAEYQKLAKEIKNTL